MDDADAEDRELALVVEIHEALAVIKLRTTVSSVSCRDGCVRVSWLTVRLADCDERELEFVAEARRGGPGRGYLEREFAGERRSKPAPRT